MSYNKMFKVTLSTALIASLMIGCQASDKQRAQIKRSGGGGGGAGGAGAGGGEKLSTNAVGKPPENSDVNTVVKRFTDVTQQGQNREVLVGELEEADYILERVMYDAEDKTAQKEKRVNLVARVDGETVCSSTASVPVAAPQSKPNSGGNNPRGGNNGTNNNDNRNIRAASVTVCDRSKVDIESSLSASNDKLALTGILSAATYLRFSAKNKALSIEDKNAATFKAGLNTVSKNLELDILAGVQGQNVFALLMNAKESSLKNKTYVLNGTEGGLNATIRKLDNGGISIAFEIAKSPRIAHMVFQYKKVAAKADTSSAVVPKIEIPKGASTVDADITEPHVHKTSGTPTD